MVGRPRVTWPRPQVLRGKWVAAWGAAFSQVQGASTEAEAEAAVREAWKSIDQLSWKSLLPDRRLQRIRSRTKAGSPATIRRSSPTTQWIVSFVWVGISKPERKENFSFETRVAPIRDQIYRELMYRPLQFNECSQYFTGVHDEPLSVAMYVLLALLAVVENGYDR
jgi:hypothetical protein